ncbi:MAG TPA: glycosyltransferase family 2 protein [Gemmatimonadaceae bacterium]|nr:glycosyltransferase family 2 protein [Gemmatimonadaceae bacterium]
MSTAIPVYIVLVNTNGWRDTIECLESVLRSDYPDVRVVVVDNGSTDDSLARIREWAAGTLAASGDSSGRLSHLVTPAVPKPLPVACRTRDELVAAGDIDWTRHRMAVVANGRNLGFTGANNVAMQYVMRHGEPSATVLLLNNDTVIAPQAITRMVGLASANDNAAAVGCTLLQYQHPDVVETRAGARVQMWNGFSRLIGWGTPRGAARPSDQAMDFISGCCILVPRAVLDRVGPLDERFFIYCEDADWGVRIRAASFRLAYCAEAEVWHKGGATAVHRSVFHDYHNAKSVLHFVWKHRPAMFGLAGTYLFARMVAPKLVRGQWARSAAVVRGIADFIRERSRADVAHAS